VGYGVEMTKFEYSDQSIFLDGKKLTGVTKLSIEAYPTERTKVTMVMYPEITDVDIADCDVTISEKEFKRDYEITATGKCKYAPPERDLTLLEKPSLWNKLCVLW